MKSRLSNINFGFHFESQIWLFFNFHSFGNVEFADYNWSSIWCHCSGAVCPSKKKGDRAPFSEVVVLHYGRLQLLGYLEIIMLSSNHSLSGLKVTSKASSLHLLYYTYAHEISSGGCLCPVCSYTEPCARFMLQIWPSQLVTILKLLLPRQLC